MWAWAISPTCSAHSAFIAYLKGTGVKLSEQQFPELYGQLKSAAIKGMEVIPETHLLRTDVFNALDHSLPGRNFVILFSDVVGHWKITLRH